jgi:hypothetical protein
MKLKRGTGQAEELCKPENKTLGVSSRESCLLKVKAQKISLKLENCAKMAPMFCGPSRY